MPGKKHILVMRFSSMGDVAMTVPVLKALLAQNPDVQITYVSRPQFAAFFLPTFPAWLFLLPTLIMLTRDLPVSPHCIVG